MELGSPEFFSALLSIILIDLILAGDNAIVIALAARNLPPTQRKQAVVWGTVCAIAIRSLMTLVVVWLLRIPGLLFVGGALLLWIASQLMQPSARGEGDGAVSPSGNLAGAIKTIIIADAVMGIDNVLGVAGAAHGSFLLVVLGLLISVPIVIWGSSFILRYVERFPSIVYLGAAVLAYTGLKMMLDEPLIQPWVELHQSWAIALGAIMFAGLLFHGWARNVNAKVLAGLAVHRSLRRTWRQQATSKERQSMQTILLPVDGSLSAQVAVRRAIQCHRAHPDVALVLLNVQPMLARHVTRFVSRKNCDEFLEQRAQSALAPARKLLDAAGVPYRTVLAYGERAAVIADIAKQCNCQRILMGTARKNSLSRLIENSVTARLLERAPVPLEIVVGTHASRLERIGVPAALASVATLAYLAGE